MTSCCARARSDKSQRDDIVALLLIAAFVFILSMSVGKAATPTAGQPPNVILMMADDLGYNDLSCYGSTRIGTPNLDRMARNGIRLTDFHAGASVCTPSRMALLSGAYPARLGWRGGVVGYRMKPGAGLARDVYTIAEAYRDAGYRTAMVGKWHLGDQRMRPMHQGFDESFYILASNNMSRDVYKNAQLIHESYDNSRLSELFTKQVVDLISEPSDQPLFLYVPFTAPHFPADPHPNWKGQSMNGDYSDVVEELDHRVGQILKAIDDHDAARNTLVVFTSDNGPEPNQRRFASAEPWSGTKWSSREGGTRVPCIIRWPGVIEPGRTVDQLVSAIDLFPTLAHACGLEINMPVTAQRLDGVNVWKALAADANGPGREHLLYWHGHGQPTAIRRGPWKLYFAAGKGDPDVSAGPVLYNLKDDPGETVDLSEKHPDKVTQLHQQAKALLDNIEKHQMPLGRSNRKDGQ